MNNQESREMLLALARGIRRMNNRDRALLLLAIACAGCTSLRPNYVAPEFEHLSHASQHWPMTDKPTHYGADIVQLTAHWDVYKRVTLDLSEGYTLDTHWDNGPREVFTGRIGYRFDTK